MGNDGLCNGKLLKCGWLQNAKDLERKVLVFLGQGWDGHKGLGLVL